MCVYACVYCVHVCVYVGTVTSTLAGFHPEILQRGGKIRYNRELGGTSYTHWI